MTPPTPPLLALLGSPQLRDRLRAAIRSGTSSRIVGPVIFARDWQELGELAKRHPGSPAVVDPGFPGIAVATPAGPARLLREPSFSAPLICYAGRSELPPSRLGPGESGIPFAAVLRAGENDQFQAIESAVLSAVLVGRVHRVLDEIGRRAREEAHSIFAQVLAKVVRPCTVPEIAADLGLSQRTLQRRCTALGIPNPKRLISLGRIFTVECLAEWIRQLTGPVAFALGFSDPSSYRRLVRRTLGAPPSVIRQRGGADYVARVVVQTLALTDPPADGQNGLPGPIGAGGAGDPAPSWSARPPAVTSHSVFQHGNEPKGGRKLRAERRKRRAVQQLKLKKSISPRIGGEGNRRRDVPVDLSQLSPDD